MKRITCKWMGSMRMGKITRILVISVLVWLIAPLFNVGAESNDLEIATRNPENEEAEIFYIFEERILIEDKSFEIPIVINSSGILIIKNGITIEMYQKHNYQYNITVKDNGTLRLQDGNLESNYDFYIHVQDKGKVILEKNSTLKVSKLYAFDTSLIRLSSSTISPGVSGLEVDIQGQSTLELINGTINDADRFFSHQNTKLEIRNGMIYADSYAINSRELNLVSNTDFKDLKINSCDTITIQSSTVSSLDVTSCRLLKTSGDSVFKNSKIRTLTTGSLSSTEIDNLRFDSIDDLEIIGCKVNIIKINVMVTNLRIINSEISQLDIEKCQKLQTYNTKFDNSKLKSSLDLVEFHSSEVKHCSIFPIEVKIYDSVIIGDEEELNDLTHGTKFEAQNASFNSPLRFTGTTEAYLINCSTSDGTSVEIPPKVIVDEEAKIYVYWWLEVQVLANNSEPLAGATVHVHDFITNALLQTSWSDENGIVRFSLLGNTITKTGWKTKNNKSYFVKGNYEDQKTQNGTGIWMKQNTKSSLDFSQVKESEPEEDNPFIGWETIIGILIFVIIIILIGLSVSGGKKSVSRDRDKPPSKTSKQPGFRTIRDNGYVPPVPPGARSRRPRSDVGYDDIRGHRESNGVGPNQRRTARTPPQKIAVNRRLKDSKQKPLRPM